MVSTRASSDYYAILGVSPEASTEEIRTAYMKRALQVHPDRNASATATKEFQALADAYYVLGDTERRSQYDREHSRPDMSSQQQQQQQQQQQRQHTDAEDVFGDVFEDILRPEVNSRLSSWWAMLGMLSGGILGIIIGNLPGAVVGGFVGRKLGSIRDRTGKPVYDSFKELPHSRKAQVLSAIAAQILGSSIGGNK
ncbi:hypothetical protein H4S06_006343 [Coemansia sp. BCRC 34490]|nr:hypothetical protein H4S06_006343 [Coemansia sp. BCRC 34490]